MEAKGASWGHSEWWDHEISVAIEGHDPVELVSAQPDLRSYVR